MGTSVRGLRKSGTFVASKEKQKLWKLGTNLQRLTQAHITNFIPLYLVTRVKMIHN